MKIVKIIRGAFSALLVRMKKMAAEWKFRRHIKWLQSQSDHFHKYIR